MPRICRMHVGAVLVLLLGATGARAQIPLTLAPESKLWIDGTSNKSDWTVEAGELAGTVQVAEEAEAAPAVQAVQVVVPALQIKSGRSTIMDRLMHKALKAEAHPEIVFELQEATLASTDGDTATLDTSGQLTIAGVTRAIEMPVQALRLDDGHLRFTGHYTLLMTDYEMTPPTAMFGALHTGDEVTVHFDVVATP